MKFLDGQILDNSQDIRRVAFKKKSPTSFPQILRSKIQELTELERKGEGLSQVDVFFPITHGKQGEDGVLQGLLELVGKPYVGSDVYGSAICMDKDVTKRLLLQHNIPVSKHKLLRNPDDLSFADAVNDLGEILFVKPCREGSSLGVSKVKTLQEYLSALKLAFSRDRKVLVEEAIHGREIECSVLGNNTPETAKALGEIIPQNDFYSFKEKYFGDSQTKLEVPANVDPSIALEIREAAREAFIITECRGMARVDFFLREDNTFVLNEINTLPGFTDISCLLYTSDAADE